MKHLIAFFFGLSLFVSASRAQTQQPSNQQGNPAQPQVLQGWVQVSAPTQSAILNLASTQSDTVWAGAGGNNGNMRSTDGGQTWQIVPTPVPYGLLAFHDSKFGYIDGGAYIYRTLDGGTTWDSAYAGGATVGAGELTVVSKDSAFGVNIVGVYRTTDQGKTWGTRALNGFCNSISFADPHHGIAVGNKGPVVLDSPQVGVVFRTVDGGNTWQELYSGLRYDLTSVAMINDSTCFAVSVWGYLAKTTNGGQSWADTLAAPLNNGFTHIAFHNADEGIAVGASGKILFTTNGGNSWRDEISGTSQDLYSAAFVDDSTIIATGTQGTVLRTTNKGLNWVSQQPIYHTLSVLAHPEPFNSTTTISYTLPQFQHVTLNVFDIAGHQVTRLLNNASQNAGRQSIPFDASTLPAGTYTYQFSSEQYSATGKLTRIK